MTCNPCRLSRDTCSDFGAVGVEQLDGECAVSLARLKAEARVIMQQHMRVGVVDRVAEVRRVARALVLIQVQQLLRQSNEHTVSADGQMTAVKTGTPQGYHWELPSVHRRGPLLDIQKLCTPLRDQIFQAM